MAITRGGRLVHARGYTWAEDGYPVTQPTTMFRLASCTKPITSIAIHQLIQEQRLRLDTTLQSVLGLQPAPGGTMDQRFNAITVLHLLTHTAGWDRSEVYDLPDVTAVARAFGQANLPESKQQMARFQAGQALQFAPGAEQEYSNLGYLMLGLIVERLRAMAYPDAVRQSVFSPRGLTRPHRSPTRQSEQQPGAGRQHDTAPGSDDLRIVPSAVSGPSSGARTNGWDSWTEANGVRGFQHGGGMPGVATRILYRTDGWGFAVFASGADVPDIYPELANLAPAQWPGHDLFPSVGIPAFPTPTAAEVTATDAEAPGDQRPDRMREIEPAGAPATVGPGV